MHHALLVNDILNLVFDYLVSESGLPFYRQPHFDRSHVRVLLALAKTCRTFHDVALDFLWVNLDDLTPLVRCLPAEAWTCKPSSDDRQVYTITRPLKGAEWDTLRRYARRVRTLRSISSSSSHIDVATICTFCHPPTAEPLFPNLRQLNWDDERLESFPFIHHFVGRQTTSLVISRWVSAWTVGGLSVLSSLPARCPGLTDISFPSSSDTYLHETVSDMLGNWMNLRTVFCEVSNENVLARLGSLQKLESLHFKLDDEVFLGPSKCLPDAFKSLRRFSLVSASLVGVTNLMHRLSMSPEEVCVQVDPWVELDVLNSYFNALKQTCRHDHLHKIDLVVNAPRSSALLCPTATLVDFVPLICFTNLTSIHLGTCCRIDLTGEDLLHLTSAWPKLKALSLNSGYGWWTSRGVTLEHLAQIVRKCRLLEQLSIVIDTTGCAAKPAESQSDGFVSLVSHLHVLDSTIEPASITPMAAFLSGLFPKLQRLSSFQWGVHAERWIAVGEQMRRDAGRKGYRNMCVETRE